VVDFSAYTGAYFETFILGVPYGTASPYTVRDPVGMKAMGVRASVATLSGAPLGTLVASAANVVVGAGVAATLVALPPSPTQAQPADGGTAYGSLLVCIDTAANVGLAGTCQLGSN